jgi:CheY-like chemotaxis protein
MPDSNAVPPDDPLWVERGPHTPAGDRAPRAAIGQGGGAALRHAPDADALRVMVVDDNADAADTLGVLAEILGCEARVCHGGEEALAALQEGLPDVLLLDLSMPRVDGLAVAASARTMAGGRPLMLAAVTALGALEARTATALAGFHFHLVKPVGVDELRKVLDQCRAIRAARPSRPGGRA